MSRECPFCGIIRGEQESEKVYEDEDVLAILDIRPSTPGHTLVIPKKHKQNINQLSEADMASLFSAVDKVVEKIGSALSPDGFNVGWNQGEAAGQAVPHIHIHVLPRFEDDQGGPVQAVVRNEPDEDVSSLATKIRKASTGKKPVKQRSRVGREAKKKSRKEGKSPQERQLESIDEVPGTEERDKDEDKENEKDEEEEDERNKSARKQWEEMKKARY